MNEIRERLTTLSGPGPLMGIGTWAIGGPTWATDGKPIIITEYGADTVPCSSVTVAPRPPRSRCAVARTRKTET